MLLRSNADGIASEDWENSEGLELALNDDGLFAASNGDLASGCNPQLTLVQYVLLQALAATVRRTIDKDEGCAEVAKGAEETVGGLWSRESAAASGVPTSHQAGTRPSGCARGQAW